MRQQLLLSKLMLLLCMIVAGVNGVQAQSSLTLYHESFGDNSGSARNWDNSYSIKTGLTTVYSEVNYTITDAKQSKNTMGKTSSALVSGSGKTGVFIVGPLSVAKYESLTVTNYFGMSASTWNTSNSLMKLSYSTDGATYTEVSKTGSNPSKAVSSNNNLVQASYSLPAAAQTATLYLKFEFYCYQVNKNGAEIGQAYFDEVELTGSELVASKPKVATIGELTSTTLNYGADGIFAPTITPAEGLTASDYTVAWTEVDNDQIILTEEGEYVAGEAGNVDVTVTVTPVASKAEDYEAVSKTFSLTIVDNRAEAGLAWSANEVRIELNAEETDYTLPTLSNPNNLDVTYESTNEDVAMVDGTAFVVETGVVGFTTINAVFTGNESYKPMTVSYTISVYDPNAKGTLQNPYTVAEIIEMAPTSTSAAVKSDVYVRGFIVGSYDNGAYDKFSATSKTESVLALADNYNETEYGNTIPVELKSGTDIRSAFNVNSKSYNVGIAEIVIKGDVLKYYGAPGIKNLEEATKVAEQVSISSVGMATYYTDCALDFTGLTDMYAYIATLNGDAIAFTRVNKVPANTGLLLSNPNKNTAASNLVPVTTETTENVDGNKFGGTLTAQTYTTEGYYILNDGSNGLGFYQVNKTSGSKVGVHRAYLDATSVSARAFIGFDDDSTTTGIEAVEGSLSVFGEFYNLNGQRVVAPQKGLYIVNGKKVLFK